MPTLAAFYDIVAIEFLNLLRPHSWSRDMAFYIGGNYVPERITRAHWEAFARDLRMPPKRLLARLEVLTERVPQAAHAACEDFVRTHGNETACGRLEESIRRRCDWSKKSVLHVP
ncbi:MAG: hypothetical protein HYR49_00510 [Gammaproteobacteria bacterium]|nr:hypothetical protein [Gammaproteobacteria bacterium]